MDNEKSPSIANTADQSPVIVIRALPVDITLSLSSNTTTKVLLEFILYSSQPITIFVLDTLLTTLEGGPSLIHETFSFTDTVSGTQYKAPTFDWTCVIDHNDYKLSYTNSENFLTLYPNTPYTVHRQLWPKSTDGNSQRDPYNMESGHSYRMGLLESEKKQHLWWTWGRKWQVLQWRWWPFKEVKTISDSVRHPASRKDLVKIEFLWEGDCVVHVVD